MSDLVGNPKDLFSHNEAHIDSNCIELFHSSQIFIVHMIKIYMFYIIEDSTDFLLELETRVGPMVL